MMKNITGQQVSHNAIKKNNSGHRILSVDEEVQLKITLSFSPIRDPTYFTCPSMIHITNLLKKHLYHTM